MTGRTGRTGVERYELVSRLAAGGMGVVWHARDTVLGRDVALKVLRLEYADDPAFRARFAVEARHAAALAHPNVCAVLDFGELPGDGRPFLAMELVDGPPLSARLTDGALLPEVALDLVQQAAAGLAAAHDRGLVHRDVKPANLLVTRTGTVQVADFGIAHPVDGPPTPHPAGDVVGTPDYLAPEQCEGGHCTPATDVYALGVVLWECLTGERPFSRDSSVATALAHLCDPPPPLPPHVAPSVAAVLGRALAKDPAARFPDAGSLARALRAADPVPPARPVEEPPRTRPLLLAAAASALLAAAGAALVLGQGPHDRVTASGDLAQQTAAGAAVRLRPTAYVGEPVSRVRTALVDRGLQVRVVAVPTRTAGPGAGQPGTVAAMRPSGRLTAGTVVTVLVRRDGAPPVPTTTEVR